MKPSITLNGNPIAADYNINPDKCEARAIIAGEQLRQHMEDRMDEIKAKEVSRAMLHPRTIEDGKEALSDSIGHGAAK